MSVNGVPFAELSFKRIREAGEITLKPSNATHAIIHKRMAGQWHVLPSGESELKDTMTPLSTATKKGAFSNRIIFSIGEMKFVGVKPKHFKPEYYFYKTDRVDDQMKEEEAVGSVFRTKLIGKNEYKVIMEKDVPEILPAFVMFVVCIMEKRDIGSTSGAASGAGAF